MSRYRFPGYTIFLEDAARRIGHPEAEGPARKVTVLSALGNLCAQAGDAAPEHVPAIMAKAAEFRDQLHAAYEAAELILADVHGALSPGTGLGRRSPRPVRHGGACGKKKPPDVGPTSRRNLRLPDPQGFPTAMTETPIAFATDEDIALRASADFAILCPKDQCLAYGTDGAFDPADRWALTSASVDFNANGLAPGQVVRLSQPVGSFKPPGESFAVATVVPNGLRLRRKGQPVNLGQPASPPGGVSGVEFTVVTLGPQIARASYDLNRRYGIDDLIAGRRPSDLFDPHEVREAVVLAVLYRQYLEMSRGPQERADTFASKSEAYKQELDDLLSRSVIHWAASPGVAVPSQATTRFSTRITR